MHSRVLANSCCVVSCSLSFSNVEMSTAAEEPSDAHYDEVSTEADHQRQQQPEGACADATRAHPADHAPAAAVAATSPGAPGFQHAAVEQQPGNRAAIPASPRSSPSLLRAIKRDDAVAQSAAERALLGASTSSQPLKEIVYEMRSRVAHLELQLERTLRSRETVEQQLAAAQQQLEAQQAFWEARLADKARELELLSSKVKVLEAADAGKGRPMTPEVRASISTGDAALLQAYQSENEAATRRIKVGFLHCVFACLLCMESGDSHRIIPAA